MVLFIAASVHGFKNRETSPFKNQTGRNLNGKKNPNKWGLTYIDKKDNIVFYFTKLQIMKQNNVLHNTEPKNTVVQLKSGEKGIIENFSNDDIPVKLQELGCLPGNEIKLIQFSPFKDLLYLTINDSHFSIRKETAALIKIRRLN